MQLVRPGVMQLNTVADKWFNEAAVTEKFGVPAGRVGDFLALAGDKVDGIPGAPGIGPKAAAALLGAYGSIGGILRHAGEIERASWRRIIFENREQIRMSRMLVALDHAAAPRKLSLDAMSAPATASAWSGLSAWKRDQIER